MAHKVLVLDGHPGSNNLVTLLVDTYANACRSAGAEVRVLALRDLAFDLNLGDRYRELPGLEPDLQEAQTALTWCTHLAVVYPTWWGAPPALLKGFIERTFMPGFAFNYRPNSPWWDRLLTGRSGRIISTQNTPVLFNWLVYRSSNVGTLKRQVLHFCGVKPVRVTQLAFQHGQTPPTDTFIAQVSRAAQHDCR